MLIESTFRKFFDEKRGLRKLKTPEIDQVAKDLLYYFPFGSVHFPQEKKLKQRLNLLRKAYIDIANAEGRPLEGMESVQNILKEGGFWKGEQWTSTVHGLKVLAITSMDNVYSFPERYPQIAHHAEEKLKDPDSVSANDWMAYIDRESEIEDLSIYARFLRKKIAYYQISDLKLEPITWFQAVQDWGNLGGNPPEDYADRVKDLPYGMIDPYKHCENKNSKETFRKYVFGQIVENYKKRFNVPLTEEKKADLLKKLENEQTHRDLVFYCAYPSQLEIKEATATPQAKEYLLMGKYYSMLCQKYTFSDFYFPLIWKWLSGWKMDWQFVKQLTTDLDQNPKPSLESVLNSVQGLSPKIINENSFSCSAMGIVLTLANWPPDDVLKRLSCLCYESSWMYFELDLVEFLSFLRNNRDLMVQKGYGSKLEALLNALGCKERSPLFLDALWQPLSEELFSMASNCICSLNEEEISTENTLKILLHFENNAHYLNLFQAEVAKLTSKEKFWFLLQKNDLFPKKNLSKEVKCFQIDQKILQGHFGSISPL